MPDETPQDPVTALAAGAASAHELFTVYVDAGFGRHEALYLLGVILTAGMRGAPPPSA